MTVYFLDSSALLKRYLDEVGSLWVRQITQPYRHHRIVISQITVLEVISGFSRRKREGTITERTAAAMRILLNRHAAREYDVVGFTPEFHSGQLCWLNNIRCERMTPYSLPLHWCSTKSLTRYLVRT